MKVAAAVARTRLPAEASQRHRKNTSAQVTCDNDGHYTTLVTAASVTRLRSGRPKTQGKIATPTPAVRAAATPVATSKTSSTSVARGAIGTASAVTTVTVGASCAEQRLTKLGTKLALSAGVGFWPLADKILRGGNGKTN